MNHDDFFEEVWRRSGAGERAATERVILATLVSLRERLDDVEAHAFSEGLPEALAQVVREGHWMGDFSLSELYDRVGRRAGVERVLAVEVTLVVLQTVGERLPHDARVLLQRHLAGEWSEALTPRRVSVASEASVRSSHPPRHTLSEGRMGSDHPLSEASSERAQRHSVVTEDNPHGDTKLSSAAGLTQEVVGESLSTKHPHKG